VAVFAATLTWAKADCAAKAIASTITDLITFFMGFSIWFI
jgi:hypothetical protein